MAEIHEAAVEEDGRLECAICKRNCFADHAMLTLGNTTIWVSCRSCEQVFRVEVRALMSRLRLGHAAWLANDEGDGEWSWLTTK